jgi:hypothetical protein
MLHFGLTKFIKKLMQDRFFRDLLLLIDVYKFNEDKLELKYGLS